jgi:hypothetical protein
MDNGFKLMYYIEFHLKFVFASNESFSLQSSKLLTSTNEDVQHRMWMNA